MALHSDVVTVVIVVAVLSAVLPPLRILLTAWALRWGGTTTDKASREALRVAASYRRGRGMGDAATGRGGASRASLDSPGPGTSASDPVPMTALKAAPCDFGRHDQAGDCDCRVCGWHVWDRPPTTRADGSVVDDGFTCYNGRPRADRYGAGR